MSSPQNTQYTPVAQVMSHSDSYQDFALFDTNEPSTHASCTASPFSDKDEIFLQQAIGLLESAHQANDHTFNNHTFNDHPFQFFGTITPFIDSPFETPDESPYTDFFSTPIINHQNTPFFTPFETPHEEFEPDPELSPFEKHPFEKDEGYGTAEFKRIYSPDRFDGNPSTLLHTAEKPIIDFEAAAYDPDETTGTLIEPLGSTSYMDEVPSSSSSSDRKRKNSSLDTITRRFPCKHPGCDKAFARLFNLNTHEKTHDPHREKPFRCRECTKSFARKHDLYRHEASVHRGERHFTCKRCAKPFSRKDALRRHVAIKGCPGTGSTAENDIDMDSGVSTSGSDDSSAEV
ncbi:hypothetical protein BC937DRAFT_94828 [Endogone sp. FLAS-F59071]|nr:hypothetical protein BC937DRAFT_94828 [Endogone sp. FLAS-F59071]|eukprot:RUS13757.1 hypothetical protein BC937DRAFT_94828 [Endogone sp. FLAS-F59071]